MKFCFENIYNKTSCVEIDIYIVKICKYRSKSWKEFEDCISKHLTDELSYQFARTPMMRKIKNKDPNKFKDILNRYEMKMNELIKKWLRSALLEYYGYGGKHG